MRSAALCWLGLGLGLVACGGEPGEEGVDVAAATVPRPDLSIASLKGPASSTGPLAVEVKVCNRGQAPAPPTSVNVYVSRDTWITGITSRAPDPFAGQLAIGGLQVGQCQVVRGDLFVSVPQDGAYYLAGIVDELNAVRELSEGNNTTITGPIGIGFRSDLIVTAISAPPSTTGPFRAEVRVCNQGTQPSSGNQVNLYLSADRVLRGIAAFPQSADPLLGLIMVPPLGAGQCTDVAQDENAWVAQGAWNLAAFVDEHKAETELIETNNTFMGGVIGVGYASDLVVSKISAPLSANGPFSTSAKICNQGTSPSNPSQVSLYASTDAVITTVTQSPTRADFLAGTAPAPGLGAGQCADVAIPATPPPGPNRAYYLGAVVDEYNSELELIETNNRSTVELIGIGNGPDLVVTKIAAPPSTNGSFEATITACNRGTQPSSNAEVFVYLSSDEVIEGINNPWPGDPFVGSVQLPGLDAGRCASQSQTFYAAFSSDGPYFLAGVVDPFNAVPELIETNNTFVGGLIGVGNRADLVITQLLGPPSATGQADVAVTVCNQGTQPSGPSYTGLYLSLDTTIETTYRGPGSGDFLIGTAAIPGLASGQCASVTQTVFVWAPFDQGTAWHLGGIADDPGSEPELIESNNTFVGALIGIGFGSDLVVASIELPPSVDGAFEAQARICNQGTSRSNATQVSLYQSSDEQISAGAGAGADFLVGTLPIEGIDAGRCRSTSGQLYAGQGPTGPGAAFFGAVVDEWNGEPELIETNNTTVVGPVGVGHGPDLVITAIAGPPSTTGAFDATVTVCNHGTAPAQPADVQVYLTTDEILDFAPGALADPLAGFLSFEGIDAGRCASVRGSFFVPFLGPDTAAHLAAVVDPFGNQQELIESNNTFVAGLIGVGFGPDLIVGTIGAPPSTNGSLALTVELCNQGTQPAGFAEVAVYLSSDDVLDDVFSPFGDTFVGSSFFNDVQPGACVSRSEQFWVPGGNDGPYRLIAVADPFHNVTELIESNNQQLGPTIGVGNRADLVVTALEGPPSASGQADIDVTVCNQGTQPSGPSYTGLYLSVDTTLESAYLGPGSSDILVGTADMPSLLAGQCATVTQSVFVWVPFDQGTAWHLGAIADDASTEQELIESNNVYVGALIGIGFGPDLIVAAIDLPPSVDGAFEAQVRICNQGTTRSGPSQVNVYQSSDETLSAGFGAGADFFVGSAPIEGLEPGRCGTASGQFYANSAPTGPGAAFFGAVVDETNGELELIESNNTRVTGPIGVGYGPDLVITAIAGPPSTTGAFDATVTVCNRGTAMAQQADVQLYLTVDARLDAGPGPTSDPFAGFLSFAPIVAGRCATVAGSFFVPFLGPDTAAHLAAVVDPFGNQQELIESNNTFIAGLIGVGFGPDLVVGTIGAPPSTNGSIALTVELCNQGTQPGSFAEVAVYLSSDDVLDDIFSPFGDTFVSSSFFNDVQPGACVSRSEQFWVPGGNDGPYRLIAVADPFHNVTELIESNNQQLGPTIGVGNRADLVVTALEGPPSASGQADIDVTVCNQGTQPSGPSSTGLYLSLDTTIETAYLGPGSSDILAGTAQMPPLPAGQCATVTQSVFVWVPFDQGTAWHLGAIADDASTELELIESNNVYAGALIGVGFGSDLVLSSLEATVSPGGQLGVDFTVCNFGTTFSLSTSLNLYLSSDDVLIGIAEAAPGSLADPLLGTATIFSLGPDQCATQNASFYAPVPPGSYRLGGIVDEFQNELELIETNNGGLFGTVVIP